VVTSASVLSFGGVTTASVLSFGGVTTASVLSYGVVTTVSVLSLGGVTSASVLSFGGDTSESVLSSSTFGGTTTPGKVGSGAVDGNGTLIAPSVLSPIRPPVDYPGFGSAIGS
jgi:hypothetical protein